MINKRKEDRKKSVRCGAYRCTFDCIYLNTKNAKDDEEGTADEDNVANRLERRDEGLDYQFQPWSPADHPGGPRMRQIQRGRVREANTVRLHSRL